MVIDIDKVNKKLKYLQCRYNELHQKARKLPDKAANDLILTCGTNIAIQILILNNLLNGEFEC